MIPGARRWTERDRPQLVRRDRNESAIAQSSRHSSSDPSSIGVDCTENTGRMRILHNIHQLLNVIFMFSGVFGSVGNNAGMRTIGSPMSLVRSHLPFPHPPSPPRDPPPVPTHAPDPLVFRPPGLSFLPLGWPGVGRPTVTRPRRSRSRSAPPTSRNRRWRTLAAPCPRSHRRRARL